jgi:hypothetical protein
VRSVLLACVHPRRTTAVRICGETVAKSPNRLKSLEIEKLLSPNRKPCATLAWTGLGQGAHCNFLGGGAPACDSPAGCGGLVQSGFNVVAATASPRDRARDHTEPSRFNMAAGQEASMTWRNPYPTIFVNELLQRF